jgi:hypothetical protein
MIKEYAVDPNAYTRNIDSLQRFFIDFRAENGRVVAAIPHNWAKEQKEKITLMGLKPIQKQKCLDEVNNLAKHSVIPGVEITVETDRWIEKARSVIQQNQIELEAVITSTANEANREFDYSTIMFSSPQNWTLDNTVSVRREALTLAQAISTSLSIADICLFVDPYFYPAEDRFRNVFREFIVRLASGRQQCRKAYLHTAIHRRGRTREQLEESLNRDMQPLLPAGFTLETWIWPRAKLHDRFVLSKQVGFAFGHGLDEATYAGAIDVNVNRLSEESRKKEFRTFSSSAQRQGDPIVIVGT